MSCSRTQHGVACGDRTQDLSIRSPTLYHYATALPWFLSRPMLHVVFCRSDPCYMYFFCRSDPCYTQNHDSCFPASNIDLSFPSVVRFVWVSTVYKLSLRMRKLRIWISDQVRHKSACTVTEAGWKLEILDLRKRGCTICVAKIKALISFAGQRLRFRTC